MNIAIIGGGISGLCIALEAAKKGTGVTLYEKNKIMGQTSSASSKLLHGGLRYLETLDFKLVKEALTERTWWLENVQGLTQTIELHLPIFKSSIRSKVKYKVGLWLYDKLAGKNNIGHHKWLNKDAFIAKNKDLKAGKLTGGFIFYDGQMLDYELGCWVADEARKHKVKIKEHHAVTGFDTEGRLWGLKGENTRAEGKDNTFSNNFDLIINASGAYTEQLLIENGIKPKYQIDHVRGSHLVIDRTLTHGYFLEVPNDKRIFFVLPYKQQTLIGTTEEIQTLSDPINCSMKEKDYLIHAYNHYFSDQINKDDIVDSFAGLRPLIKSGTNLSRSSREYAIQKDHKLISVYGGKWTTARALAKNVCDRFSN
jgi:glycerol-3-phosphate dehydrogenase